MQLPNHTEYQTVYLRNQAAFARCRAAIEQWRATDDPIVAEPYDLIWTPATVREFVHELAALFTAYNQVLWQHFSYCSQCGGQCCVVDASDVRPFDLLAIALLDTAAPTLPARIATNAHACIYLNGQHCSWPTGWRTIKCWSFYCLGSGSWEASIPLSELYRAVTLELQQVVAAHLPTPLRRYEATHNLSLSDLLDDPVAFANGLHMALDSLFVAPFHRSYPCLDATVGPFPSYPTSRKPDESGHIFDLQLLDDATEENRLDSLAALSTEVLQVAGQGAEEMLADLETLAWIAESHPTQAPRLVREMYQRYTHLSAPVGEQLSRAWLQMRVYLQRLA